MMTFCHVWNGSHAITAIPDPLDLQSALRGKVLLLIFKRNRRAGRRCLQFAGWNHNKRMASLLTASSTSGIKYYMDGNNFKGNYYNSKIAPDDAVCFQRYSFGGRGNPTLSKRVIRIQRLL